MIVASGNICGHFWSLVESTYHTVGLIHREDNNRQWRLVILGEWILSIDKKRNRL